MDLHFSRRMIFVARFLIAKISKNPISKAHKTWFERIIHELRSSMNEPGKNSLVTPSSQHPQPIGVSQATKKQVKGAVTLKIGGCRSSPKDPIWSLGFAWNSMPGEKFQTYSALYSGDKMVMNPMVQSLKKVTNKNTSKYIFGLLSSWPRIFLKTLRTEKTIHTAISYRNTMELRSELHKLGIVGLYNHLPSLKLFYASLPLKLNGWVP